MEASIEDMFDYQRLPRATPHLLLLLLLYAPLGLVLLLLRLFIGLHVFLVSCALPDCPARRFLVRVMCSVLGMHVRQVSPAPLGGPAPRLLVANHLTPFDHNMLNLLTPCTTPMLEGCAGFVCWARGFLELAGGPGGAEPGLRAYTQTPGAPPLLLFPEDDTTNGRAGLLRFSAWPFSLAGCVQPVALQVKRPLLSLTTPGSSWLTELLWTFFLPVTVYQVRWLPPVSRQEGETLQEYANAVQELLAAELGVACTQVTRQDKQEHLKRKRHTSLHTARGEELARMAQQVKEVLPDVPLGVITRDLVQTSCVDLTITNLLESSEPFPEVAGPSLGATPGPSSGATAGPTRRMAVTSSAAAATPTTKSAELFGRSAVERHLSLEERKNSLYQSARRRYIEKHGLKQE